MMKKIGFKLLKIDRFLGEATAIQFCFEIYWPLVQSLQKFKSQIPRIFLQYFEQLKKNWNFCLVSFEVFKLKGSNFFHFFEGWKKSKT